MRGNRYSPIVDCTRHSRASLQLHSAITAFHAGSRPGIDSQMRPTSPNRCDGAQCCVMVGRCWRASERERAAVGEASSTGSRRDGFGRVCICFPEPGYAYTTSDAARLVSPDPSPTLRPCMPHSLSTFLFHPTIPCHPRSSPLAATAATSARLFLGTSIQRDPVHSMLSH
jgi:hypothetical protein